MWVPHLLSWTTVLLFGVCTFSLALSPIQNLPGLQQHLTPASLYPALLTAYVLALILAGWIRTTKGTRTVLFCGYTALLLGVLALLAMEVGKNTEQHMVWALLSVVCLTFGSACSVQGGKDWNTSDRIEERLPLLNTLAALSLLTWPLVTTLCPSLIHWSSSQSHSNSKLTTAVVVNLVSPQVLLLFLAGLLVVFAGLTAFVVPAYPAEVRVATPSEQALLLAPSLTYQHYTFPETHHGSSSSSSRSGGNVYGTTTALRPPRLKLCSVRSIAFVTMVCLYTLRMTGYVVTLPVRYAAGFSLPSQPQTSALLGFTVASNTPLFSLLLTGTAVLGILIGIGLCSLMVHRTGLTDAYGILSMSILALFPLSLFGSKSLDILLLELLVTAGVTAALLKLVQYELTHIAHSENYTTIATVLYICVAITLSGLQYALVQQVPYTRVNAYGQVQVFDVVMFVCVLFGAWYSFLIQKHRWRLPVQRHKPQQQQQQLEGDILQYRMSSEETQRLLLESV